MPLTVFGDNTAPMIFPWDAKKEKPRTLRVPFWSKTEIRAWQKRCREADQIKDVEKQDAALDTLLGEVVVGWENIDAPFSIAGISDHYSEPEYMELFWRIPMAMIPRVEDLKK